MDKATFTPIVVRSVDTEFTSALSILQEEAENRLCSLRRIADSLKDSVDNMQQSGPFFNLALVEVRAKYIAAMKNIHSEVQKLLSQVAENGAAAEALHRGEIKTMQESLKRAVVSAPGPVSPATSANGEARRAMASVPAMSLSSASSAKASTVAGQEPAEARGATKSGTTAAPLGVWAGGSPVAKLALPAAGPQNRARIPIPVGMLSDADDSAPPAITLEAIVVPKELNTTREILSSVTGHELFYIPQWNHFAARVGGTVFHANVAHIYSRLGERRQGRNRARPERVRECDRASCGRRSCRYYHDPEGFPNSRDVRNFTAESFIYAPPTMSPRGTGILRRFGSASSLDIDIKLISPDEARLFVHQVSHDILCALILCKYVPGIKPPANSQRT